MDDKSVQEPWAVNEGRCKTLLVEFLLAKSNANVQERRKATTKSDTELVIHSQVIALLSDDLLFKIFMLVPAESLYRIQFVCKKWFSLINSSVFVKCHTHTQQQEAETVLICRKLASSPLSPLDGQPKRYFHFLDLNSLKDEFIESSVVNRVQNILASRDGLVLGRMDKCLILVNPVTRRHIELPLGTRTNYPGESYDLVFCSETKTYKVVHLFVKKQKYKDCEILCVQTKTWKKIGEFPVETYVSNTMKNAVYVEGSLCWLAWNMGRGFYIAIVNVQNEKLSTKNVPNPKYCTLFDRLVEIGGILGFVEQALAARQMMHIWILKNHDNGSDATWIKGYSIYLNIGCISRFMPICSRRNGKEIVFSGRHGDQLYVYDTDKGDLKLVYSREDIKMQVESVEDHYIPHLNTLASWNDPEDLQC